MFPMFLLYLLLSTFFEFISNRIFVLQQETEEKEIVKEETSKIKDNKKSWFSWIPWFY